MCCPSPRFSGKQATARWRIYINAKDFATVVWFHGGGLTGGNKFIPDELKNCGLAVIAVNYRFLPQVTIAECVDDANAIAGFSYLKESYKPR